MAIKNIEVGDLVFYRADYLSSGPGLVVEKKRMFPPGLQTKPTSQSSTRNAKSRGKTSRVWRGIGKMLYRITRKYAEVSNKKGLGITPAEWETMWGDPLGFSPPLSAHSAQTYEYQFEVGELVKLAHGFYQGGSLQAMSGW